MQVLPDRTPHGARDPHEVVQTPQSARHGGLDEIMKDLRAAPGAHPRRLQKLDVPHLVADHQPVKAAVPHQDVGAGAEQKGGYLQLAGEPRRPGELLRRACPVQQLGRPPDLEGGVGGQRHVVLDTVGAQARFDQGEGEGGSGVRHPRSGRVGVARRDSRSARKRGARAPPRVENRCSKCYIT